MSVIILTRNEEAFILRAIASAKVFADEIVVIDASSGDRTRALAEEAGAVVVEQQWLGWIEQRRRGVAIARNDWVFFQEADEIVTLPLAASIARAMEGAPDAGIGFVVERQDEFLGEMMFNMRRRAKRANFVRLYNRTRSDWRSDMLIHEEVRCPGPLIALEGALLHWRNYSIAEQVATYNRYSELEAKQIVGEGTKFIGARIVFKPVLRFLWMYVKCGHWRLGMRGFIWSVMNAVAEFLRLAKSWETLHAPRSIDPPMSIYQPPGRDDRKDDHRSKAGA